MEINENKIKVERTGVYYQVGNPAEANVNWFVCHGYGQLGEYIIRKFDRFSSRGHAIVSVEGLNRFYWQGVNGQVVSTWMTKRFRLDEIKDNNNFLSKIYDCKKGNESNIFLGFSQGGTTIWRWIFEKQPDFDVFINYAGWIPEDIELFQLKDYLSNKTLIFTYGSNDEYLTTERIKALESIIKESGLNIIIHKTEGKHSIERSILDEIYYKYVKC